MADSRRASRIFIKSIQDRLAAKSWTLLLTLIISYVATVYIIGPDLNLLQQRTLIIIFTAIGLWMTEAIPPFAVGILIIGYLVYMHGSIAPEYPEVDIAKYFNTWSSAVIWLMLGGFFLAKGMENTKLDLALFRGTVSIFGTKRKKLLLGLMLTTALGSMIMSNTATTAMMIASVTPFLAGLTDKRSFPKAVVLGIPAAASVGGMGTIIGSPPNAIAVGALTGAGIDVDFLTWMLFGFPIAITLTLFFWVVLVKKFKIQDLPEVEIPVAPPPTEEEHHLGDRRKKVLVYITIGLTMLLWMTSTLHGIPSYIVSVIPIVFLTVGGVVNSDDVRALPWDTLMLVAGGLALGIAIVDTGLAELYIGKIEALTTGDVVYPIIFVMALVTVLASNIMSNTATASILIPISIIMFPSDAVMAAVVIGLSASTALFLPISTPPNAIAFSTGQLEQKDFRLSGVFMGLAGPVIIMIWILLLNFLLS